MKTILLIEDNADIRETTEEILQLADYKVITAENGKVGVELAKEKIPDLIICDIMMPELDGYGVLKILSKNPETSSIPFIFLTSMAEKSDIRKGMNLGADDYITKPFDETELLDAVEVRLSRNERFNKNFQEGLEGLNTFFNEARSLDELNSLSQDRKVKIYKKGTAIYHEEDFANYLYYIIKGKVKTSKTDEYGKTLVNDLYKTGDYIGYMSLLQESEYTESAVAIEESELAIIPKEDFLALIQNNRDVATKFIKMLAGNINEKERRLLQLAYTPVRERVADTLLQLKTKEGSNNHSPAEYKISREDLANMVGTAKESLNRMMSDLKKEGLIDTQGQKVTIIDEVGLKRIAGI